MFCIYIICTVGVIFAILHRCTEKINKLVLQVTMNRMFACGNNKQKLVFQVIMNRMFACGKKNKLVLQVTMNRMFACAMTSVSDNFHPSFPFRY
jgi:hypothetical protein